MAKRAVKRLICAVAMLWVVDSPGAVWAQIGIGTWVQQSGSGAGLTMTVEACCGSGLRLIYRLRDGSDVLMTIESAMDGKDAPVLVGGKPSGETMGIRRVDDHHTVTVVKMNGQPFGTSKATLSADGKTLTVENEMTAAVGAQGAGKTTEVWTKR